MAFSPSYLLPMLSFLQPDLDLRPGHDQDHGGADDGHAAEDGEGGGLVEDEDAHGDGGERFAHAQDGWLFALKSHAVGYTMVTVSRRKGMTGFSNSAPATGF